MNKALGVFLILLVNAIFAFVFSLEQFALVHSYPFFITGIRTLLGGLILGAYQYYTNKQSFSFLKVTSFRFMLWLFFLIAFFNSKVLYEDKSYEISIRSNFCRCVDQRYP